MSDQPVERTTHVRNPNGIEVDLADDGLLWLINTSVFHPRGFALAAKREVLPDGSRGPVEGWLLLGDGSEPWHFLEDAPDDPRPPRWCMDRVEALFARARGDQP